MKAVACDVPAVSSGAAGADDTELGPSFGTDALVVE